MAMTGTSEPANRSSSVSLVGGIAKSWRWAVRLK